MEADEVHRPVLVDEVVELIRPRPGGRYLDCTVGAGGHAERTLVLSQPNGELIGIDRDPQALEAAARRLKPFGRRVRLFHANFVDAPAVLEQAGVAKVNAVVYDLGLSSLQLSAPDRGFSFQHRDAPLDMRADPTTGRTAIGCGPVRHEATRS